MIRLLAMLLCAVEVSAQGTFQNLNFEFANVPDVPRSSVSPPVSITDGLPGWMGFIGGNPVALIQHNGISVGSPFLSIFGPNEIQPLVISGRYSVLLESGVNFDGKHTVTIEQSGMVPATSKSIRFKAYGGIPVVTVDDLDRTVFPFSSNPNYNEYGIDIAAFAGRATKLSFTSPSLANYSTNPIFLDDIKFSSEPVPEPSALIQLGIGALAVAINSRRRR